MRLTTMRARRFGHGDLLGRENAASILEAEAWASCYKTGVSSNGERRTLALVFALGFALTPVGSARAQAPTAPLDNPAPLPTPAHLDANPASATASATIDEPPPSPPPLTRPRLSAAVGMGTSFESAGLSPARTALVPAFFATGGVGVDWPVGVEASAFASSSSGRFKAPDTPVDRLALALIGVVRPCLWSVAPGDDRYFARVARTLGLELGLGIERDGTTVRAGSRVALQAGARAEFPLSRTPATKELRVRLAARRMQGFYTPRVGTVDVGDGFELYVALVSVF
jgi:hypothetical protein